jgi:hypothetical protein
MTFWLGKNLIREDRWFKWYEMGPGVKAMVSKFRTREADIRAIELKKEWASWEELERLMFAQAFSSKPEITAEDEEILEFMMLSTDERVLVSIARCLTRHSNKRMVLRFLVDRLNSGSEPKANFLQALSILGESNAVPSIKALHERLAAEINREGSEPEEWQVRDFLVSCSVLNKLEGTTCYNKGIEPFLHHQSESIRKFSKLCLDGGLPIR